MADPLVTAIGAKAQQVLEENNIDINDVYLNDNDNYVIEVPEEDLSTSGVEVIIKGQ